MSTPRPTPTPQPPPDDDAGFVAWIEAKAVERNARGGRATLTPEERALVAARLRDGCDTFGFSTAALGWLNLQGYCDDEPEPPPARP